MRVAAFGGPYSNPYAVRALLDDAARRGCERVFCLGDLGGFGAEPDALGPLLVDGGVECIAGNYDVAIGRGDPDCGCGYRDPRDNEFAQLAYDYTRAHTSPELAAWMRTLPTERRLRLGGREVHLVHGSPLDLNDFFWESLPAEAFEARVRASGAEVILCTHSGLPWQRHHGATLVVNVGVAGRPANDGRREVWYAVVDLDGDGRRADAELVPLAYDWAAQAASMRAAGRPEAFVETIETGWWTTCLQVLPPAERARGRFHVYRSELAPGTEHDGLGPVPEDDNPDRPVVPLFGTASFPRRLSTEPGLRIDPLEAGFVEIDPDASLVATTGGFRWCGETIAPAGTPLADVKRRVVERLLTTFPRAYACA